MDKIVYIILILIIIYLLKRDFYETKIENFQTASYPPDDALAINTLAQIAKKLMDGGTTVPGNLIVSDKLTTTNLDVSGNFNLLPRGIILSWNGTSAPLGWIICDGTNGTPDLRGKFVINSVIYIMKL